jgi:NitT/TauT family transport system ATP-binding protein
MAVIVLRGLRKVFPATAGRPPTVALDGLDLDVADGEFVTVVGPSGCGKTTLLHLVAGFESPTEGSIEVDGAPVHGPGADRAVVFQQPALYPWLSVWDNIAFGLTLRHGRRGVDRAAVQRMIDTMGLHGFERHAPYELSGGMQQRTAIARALVLSPRILLMDEPFGALDAQTRADMQAFLLALWRRVRPTVLFVTHDVEEAVLLADRCLIMTARPARLAGELRIALPRPRTYSLVLDPQFTAYKREILSILRPAAPDDPAAAAGPAPPAAPEVDQGLVPGDRSRAPARS